MRRVSVRPTHELVTANPTMLDLIRLAQGGQKLHRRCEHSDR